MIVIRWYNVSIVYSEYIFIKYTPYKNTACVVNRRGRIVRNCDIVPVLNKMNTSMTLIRRIVTNKNISRCCLILCYILRCFYILLYTRVYGTLGVLTYSMTTTEWYL